MMMVMVQTTPRKTCLHDSHIHDDHREQGKALVLRIFEARFHRRTLPHVCPHCYYYCRHC